MTLPRVVVTGFGLVTPLGVGVAPTWRRLVNAECGVVSLAGEEQFQRLPCQLAARVPRGDAEGLFNEADHVTVSERRTMSLSTLYVLVAAEEALKVAKVGKVDVCVCEVIRIYILLSGVCSG